MRGGGANCYCQQQQQSPRPLASGGVLSHAPPHANQPQHPYPPTQWIPCRVRIMPGRSAIGVRRFAIKPTGAFFLPDTIETEKIQKNTKKLTAPHSLFFFFFFEPNISWLQELLQWGLDIQEVGLLGCGEAALSLMAKHMPQLPSLVYDPRRPIGMLLTCVCTSPLPLFLPTLRSLLVRCLCVRSCTNAPRHLQTSRACLLPQSNLLMSAKCELAS
jgi:hypothetical protein